MKGLRECAIALIVAGQARELVAPETLLLVLMGVRTCAATDLTRPSVTEPAWGASPDRFQYPPVTSACRIVVEGDSKRLLGVGEKCAAQVALPRILRPLNSAAAAVCRSRPSAQTVAPRTHRNSNSAGNAVRPSENRDDRLSPRVREDRRSPKIF